LGVRRVARSPPGQNGRYDSDRAEKLDPSDGVIGTLACHNQHETVSADIRALEKYLTETGFRISVYEWSQEEGVAWEDREGSWRLCHAIDHGERIELKPLIECPAAVRLWAANTMPAFLDRLAAVAGAKTGETAEVPAPPSDDDIPF
jgi:hypothetical protein